MKLVYFAWLRERIGKAEEIRELPAQVQDVKGAIAYLSGLGEEYAYAFENPAIIRAALDRKHVSASASLAGARELAFFPPMTGG